ncbi:MAG: hypothetical protein KGS72_05010 [Cyanobacteria bacterium REEB67]|nr:hypothetical protein [Cyanobacteria bacterium REEB67]
MSNTPSNISEYCQETLARFEQARAAGKFGEATIWANTSACLDSAEDRVNPLSPVNKALFQLIFDVTRDCENLVLHCGNVTTTHGALLGYADEAAASLQARLSDASPHAVRPMVIVIKAHLDDLQHRLGIFFRKGALQGVSTVEQGTYLLDTVRTVKALIASVPDIEIDDTTTFAERARLLYTCASSPDYLVYHFPFSFLTEWDRAAFFIAGAQSVVADMRSRSAFVPTERAFAVNRLSALLGEAERLIKAEDRGVKRLYPTLSDLALSLADRQAAR